MHIISPIGLRTIYDFYKGDIIGNTGQEYSVTEMRGFVSKNLFRVVSVLTATSFSISTYLSNPFSCVGSVGNPVVEHSTMNNVTNLQIQC